MKYPWTLAQITLSSGRSAELTELDVSPTYGGVLEGYPNARVNDRLIARLGQRRGSLPAHVITPPRRFPNPGNSPGRMLSRPMEVLPPVCCRGYLRSDPVSGELESVVYVSRLVVTWFQDDFAISADIVTAAVRDVPWDNLAEDGER